MIGKGNERLLLNPYTRADYGDITPPRARKAHNHPPGPNDHNGLYDHHRRGGGSTSAVKKYADPTASLGCSSARSSLHQHRQGRTACMPEVGSRQGGRNPCATLEITPPPQHEVTSSSHQPHWRFASPLNSWSAAWPPNGSTTAPKAASLISKLRPRPRGAACTTSCAQSAGLGRGG